MSSAAQSVTLDHDYIKKMKLSSVFRGTEAADAQEPVTSIDFHHSGAFCATACADGSIQLLNTQEGRSMKTVHSKKYGVEFLRFTHHNQTLLCTSKNAENDHNIRYLSLYDNKYIRFFSGHSDRVVSLAMSPVDDSFISGSIDATVRLWDIRQENCKAMLRIPNCQTNPCVAQDPTGLVFCVVANHEIRMFDAREYDAGPFTTFQLDPSITQIQNNNWHPTSIEFSSDGNSLLLATDQSVIMRLDGFDGTLKNRYQGHTTMADGMKRSTIPFVPCFSPDLKFVLSGSSDGRVLAWDSNTGEQVMEWKEHVGPVQSVRWNPVTAMFASTCYATIFWTHHSE